MVTRATSAIFSKGLSYGILSRIGTMVLNIFVTRKLGIDIPFIIIVTRPPHTSIDLRASTVDSIEYSNVALMK